MRTLAPVVRGVDTVYLALHFGDVAVEARMSGHQRREANGVSIGVEEKDFGDEVRISGDGVREVFFGCGIVCLEFCLLGKGNSRGFATHGDSSEIIYIHLVNLHP